MQLRKSPSSTKSSIWNQLYFVLATLIGLICLVIGVSTLVNTVIGTYILPVKTPRFNAPPQPYVEIQTLNDRQDLTQDQRQALAAWQKDYQLWETEQKNYDYEAENRRRSLAWSIAMIVTGVPVFALHAPVVFKRASV